MFALFYSFYSSMFIGRWYSYSLGQINSALNNALNELGTFITSIFGDNTYNNLGTALTTNDAIGIPSYVTIIAFILALITSIGIVVMAVKGIKKAFGIFFMGIRNI